MAKEFSTASRVRPNNTRRLLGIDTANNNPVLIDSNNIPGYFNVLTYGAVGDNTTDCTSAINNAIIDCLAAGGGVVYFPHGQYYVSGEILIPATLWETFKYIELRGEFLGLPMFGSIGQINLTSWGTQIRSDNQTIGAAVIRAVGEPSVYSNFSSVRVVLKNLDIKTYNNPKISGVDLLRAQQCEIENVHIGTGIYNVQASLPTTLTSIGLRLPGNDNGAFVIMRNVSVAGYRVGINVSEHTDGDCIFIHSCFEGMRFVLANHSSYFGKIIAQRNRYGLTFSGAHRFFIANYNVEYKGTGAEQGDDNNLWQGRYSEVEDPNNFGEGVMNFALVRGAVGRVSDFRKVGGSNIQAYRLGFPAAVSSYTPPAISAPHIHEYSDVTKSFKFTTLFGPSAIEVLVGSAQTPVPLTSIAEWDAVNQRINVAQARASGYYRARVAATTGTTATAASSYTDSPAFSAGAPVVDNTFDLATFNSLSAGVAKVGDNYTFSTFGAHAVNNQLAIPTDKDVYYIMRYEDAVLNGDVNMGLDDNTALNGIGNPSAWKYSCYPRNTNGARTIIINEFNGAEVNISNIPMAASSTTEFGLRLVLIDGVNKVQCVYRGSPNLAWEVARTFNTAVPAGPLYIKAVASLANRTLNAPKIRITDRVAP